MLEQTKARGRLAPDSVTRSGRVRGSAEQQLSMSRAALWQSEENLPLLVSSSASAQVPRALQPLPPVVWKGDSSLESLRIHPLLNCQKHFCSGLLGTSACACRFRCGRDWPRPFTGDLPVASFWKEAVQASPSTQALRRCSRKPAPSSASSCGPAALRLHGGLLLGCPWKRRRLGVWSFALPTEIEPRRAHRQEGLLLLGWVLLPSQRVPRGAEQGPPACQAEPRGLGLEEPGCCCRGGRGKGRDGCGWRTTGAIWAQTHQQEDPSGLGLSARPVSMAAGQCPGLWVPQADGCSKGRDSPVLARGSGRLGRCRLAANRQPLLLWLQQKNKLIKAVTLTLNKLVVHPKKVSPWFSCTAEAVLESLPCSG